MGAHGVFMGQEKYIWCRDCNEIHYVSPFDKAPAYALVHGVEQKYPMDDWRAFMQRHGGHKLEGLRSAGEKYSPSARPMDPMKEEYVEVTNGQDRFVIRSSRGSIDEPLHFELIKGRLTSVGATLDIQENEIRKEMKFHFAWSPLERLDNRKIDLFIALFRDLVFDLSPEEVRICGYSYSDSSVAYGLLPSGVLKALLQKCTPHFLPYELNGIGRFIEAHRGEDGVLALLIRQRYRVEESRA